MITDSNGVTLPPPSETRRGVSVPPPGSSNGTGTILLPFDDLPPVADTLPPGVAMPTRASARERAQNLTHDDLTRLGTRWLRGNQYVAFRETGTVLSNGGTEIADVIAWSKRGVSVLVECKRTRADFKKDREKVARRHEAQGFGVLRYYLCPAGLLSPDEMPPKWGLLWAYEDRVVQQRKPTPFDTTAAALAERGLLVTLLTRVDYDYRMLAYETGRKHLPSRYE